MSILHVLFRCRALSNVMIRFSVHCFADFLSCCFSLFISLDVWKEAQKLSGPALALRVPQLLDLVLVSSVPSTSEKNHTP